MITADALRALAPENTVRTWNIDDCLLYALGVGAGSLDPRAETHFTTENSTGVVTQVVPTYGIILCGGGPELLEPAGVRAQDVLLISERLELFGQIPTGGTVSVEHTIGTVHEHPRGHIVEMVNIAALDGGTPLCRTTARTLVIDGAQPRRGERAARPAAIPPGAAIRRLAIPPNQALLYRLTAGRNPLHSDPQLAAEAGHDVPILHGRCTSGFVARELVSHELNGDPTRLRQLNIRFVGPVFPGDLLEIAIDARADGGDVVLYRVDDHEVVLTGSYLV